MSNERKSFLNRIGKEIVPSLTAHSVVLAQIPHASESPALEISTLKGSGTLVKFESSSTYGIVTAGHVIGALENSRLPDDTFSFLLFLKPSGHGRQVGPVAPMSVQIPRHEMIVHGKSNKRIDGPDIAWIPLNPDMAREIESHRSTGAVFFNFEKRYLEFTEIISCLKYSGRIDESVYGKDYSCYAIGWNAEKQISSGGNEFTTWCCEVIPDKLHSIGEWQFMDYNIDSKHWNHIVEENDGTSPRTVFVQPRHWGGMSGGSIWHIYRDPRNLNKLVRHYGGTIFYCDPSNNDGRNFRSHVFTDILRVLSDPIK